MTRFGNTLKGYRQASNDPERLNRRLTQERLGALIGDEMGDMGVSGAAISAWELGKNKINAEDRKVLVSLVRVLYRCGGLKTPSEADQFLNLGNYRALNEEENRSIFQTLPDGIQLQQIVFEEEISEANRILWLADMFSISKKELGDLIDKAKDGPGPPWSRVLAAFMRKATDRVSLSRATILWIWVWLLAWWMTGPSLQLPYANRDAAFLVLCVYAVGTLIIPLLIGVLVNTKDSEYWKEQAGVHPFWLRLYTYQGAAIGFNIGYLLVFPLNLAMYYLGFRHTILMEVIAAAVCVLLGNMAARVVPHNLWLAYQRLTFKDGGIFFIVAFLGPMWAFFFLEYHTILLRPAFGIIIILLAITLIVIYATRKSKKQVA